MRKNFIKPIFLSCTLLTSQLVFAHHPIEDEQLRQSVIPGILERMEENIDNYEHSLKQRSTPNDVLIKFLRDNTNYSNRSINKRMVKNYILQDTEKYINSQKELSEKISKTTTFEHVEEIIKGLLLDRLIDFQQLHSYISTMCIKEQNDYPKYLYRNKKNEFYNKLTEYDKISINRAIDAYQTNNFIIIELLSLTNLTKLSPEVKDLIRSSPTLWLKIQKLDLDLGLPDEGFFTESKENLSKKDLYLYHNHFLQKQYMFEQHPAKPHFTTTSFIAYEGLKGTGREVEKDEILPLPYPPCLKNPAEASYLPYPSIIEKTFPILLITNDNKKMPFINLRNKSLENITSSNSSSSNRFLKKEDFAGQAEVEFSKRSNNEKSSIIKASKKKKKRSSKKRLSPALKSNIETPSPIQNEKDAEKLEEPKIIAEKSDISDIKDDLLSPFNEKESEETEEYTPIDYSIYKKKNSKNKPKETSVVDTQPALDNSQVSIVKGSHKATLVEIFDPEAYTNVNYRKFKSFWSSIGGHIVKRSSKGSHRTIVFENKKYGIFRPHGKNDGYAPKTIAKIRKILTEIGYNPNRI